LLSLLKVALLVYGCKNSQSSHGLTNSQMLSDQKKPQS
jgi:hypothetical protein